MKNRGNFPQYLSERCFRLMYDYLSIYQGLEVKNFVATGEKCDLGMSSVVSPYIM